MTTYTRFADIPPFTPWSGYRIDVSWNYLDEQLKYYDMEYGVELDPDFQRGHVWSHKQQVAYVEHCLRGGQSTNLLHWNCIDWRYKSGGHPVVLVDGKQRLTAVLAFLHDDLRAFGTLHSEYEDHLRLIRPTLKFHINDLATRAAVLQWYLELNAGGVVHTDDEIEKVRRLLDAEK